MPSGRERTIEGRLTRGRLTSIGVVAAAGLDGHGGLLLPPLVRLECEAVNLSQDLEFMLVGHAAASLFVDNFFHLIERIESTAKNLRKKHEGYKTRCLVAVRLLGFFRASLVKAAPTAWVDNAIPIICPGVVIALCLQRERTIFPQ